MEKLYKIGQHIFIGCNSQISEGKTPYREDKTNNSRFLDLTKKEAIVLSEPWEEDIKFTWSDESIKTERILVRLVENGKEYSIYNGYHSTSLKEVTNFIERMDRLAEDLARDSEEMIGYSDN